MKTLNRFIFEKLKLGKNTKVYGYYKFYPKDFDELRNLIEQLLEERGPHADLNDIDVSQVTSFGDTIKTGKYKDYWGLFYGLNPHNIDISEWNVSNVENMRKMFWKCKKFNCNLSGWDVSNVKYMDRIFRDCENFTGKGLENWDVSNVKDMVDAFEGCVKFDCDLSKWDVSNVKDIRYMFYNCENFTGKGLENWDVHNVTDIKGMFYNCKKFNCDLSKWNVSKVSDTAMENMFDGCDSLKNKPSWYKY